MTVIEDPELFETRNEHLITENTAPHISEFFEMPEHMSPRKRQDLLEFGKKILRQKALGSDDELALEESYDYLSQVGFDYLFPRILKAYLDGTFEVDGNFYSRLADTCTKDESFVSRKHGRGKRMDRLEGYMESLSDAQKEVLLGVLEQLECA